MRQPTPHRIATFAVAATLLVALGVAQGLDGAPADASAAAQLPPAATTVCRGDHHARTARPFEALAQPHHTAGRWCVSTGAPRRLGGGWLRTYAVFDRGAPAAIGVVFPAATLHRLPTTPTDGRHCYDLDRDGRIDTGGMTECMGGHERVLDLPPALRGRRDVPLRWALVNYQPHGHGPPGVYTLPHLDFHFYLQSRADRDAIRPGPCGLLVDCADFERGRRPVPADYLPRDYTSVDAVEVAMGNHLVDLSAPEFTGGPFEQTFIYGSYDGRITFLEPMLATRLLHDLAAGRRRGGCVAVKQPRAWQAPGRYPGRYCVRYDASRTGQYTVSLEDLTLRP